MGWTISRTLGAIALDKLVDISLVTIKRIVRRKIEQEIERNFKRKRGIDIDNPEIDIVILAIRAVQKYVTDLPSTLMNDLTKELLKSLVDYEYYLEDARHIRLYFTVIIELALSPNLTCFHDEWILFQDNMDIIDSKVSYFRRLFKCSNLRELSLTRNPQTGNVRRTIIKTFPSFSHLTTLFLLPENTAESFHWVISSVVHSCPKLKIFHIVYDGQRLEHQEDRVGIKDIVQCRDLVSLFLYDCSKFTSVNVVDDLHKLLMGLKYLKYIFHKRMISAILELSTRISGQLRLERLDFFQDYEDMAYRYMNGYKILVDTDELFRLCKTCPAIKVLRLAQPPKCLLAIASILPNLEVLDMTECHDIIGNLHQTIHHNLLTGLTILKLTDVSYMDYGFFSELARSCPSLEAISIERSTIIANGQLIKPRVSAFPFLKKLILKPQTPIDMWEVGINLTYYFLTGAYEIRHVDIQYDPFYMDIEDNPTNLPRPNIFMSLKRLTFIRLITAPHILCNPVKDFISRNSLIRIISYCDCHIIALRQEGQW
nr:MAG: hypothetical protein [Penaeus semisulcatus pemonivirus]